MKLLPLVVVFLLVYCCWAGGPYDHQHYVADAGYNDYKSGGDYKHDKTGYKSKRYQTYERKQTGYDSPAYGTSSHKYQTYEPERSEYSPPVYGIHNHQTRYNSPVYGTPSSNNYQSYQTYEPEKTEYRPPVYASNNYQPQIQKLSKKYKANPYKEDKTTSDAYTPYQKSYQTYEPEKTEYNPPVYASNNYQPSVSYKKEISCVGTGEGVAGVTGTCQKSVDCVGLTEENKLCIDGTECCLASACKVNTGQIGTCINQDVCKFARKGIVTARLCPGDSTIKCCVEPPVPCFRQLDIEQLLGGPAGVCINNAVDKCAGITTTDLCPGPATTQCCTVLACQLEVDGTIGKCIHEDMCSGASIDTNTCPGDTKCCTPAYFGGKDHGKISYSSKSEDKYAHGS